MRLLRIHEPHIHTSSLSSRSWFKAPTGLLRSRKVSGFDKSVNINTMTRAKFTLVLWSHFRNGDESTKVRTYVIYTAAKQTNRPSLKSNVCSVRCPEQTFCSRPDGSVGKYTCHGSQQPEFRPWEGKHWLLQVVWLPHRCTLAHVHPHTQTPIHIQINKSCHFKVLSNKEQRKPNSKDNYKHKLLIYLLPLRFTFYV